MSRQRMPILDGILDQLAEAVAVRVAHRLAAREPERRQLSNSEPAFLSEAEIARRTGLSRRTLQGWRTTGRGPRFIKTGRRVLYPVAELEQFLAMHERRRDACASSSTETIPT